MPSFSDSIVLFILALLLFGPKKLPVLARELGKWVGEFRRASNEFKMQMEEELRAVEQADRQKQIAAMEAAAPVTPPIVEPEHPSIPSPGPSTESSTSASPEPEAAESSTSRYPEPSSSTESDTSGYPEASASGLIAQEEKGVLTPAPLPIATSGDLNLMPPATGLPTPRSNDALGGLLNSIPPAEPTELEDRLRESALHGD
jgi:sec-independent protein translocase protein TatB